jgi:hypothetical protein
MKLTRYWFEFDLSDTDPCHVRMGCGVTAWSLEDAKELMRQQVFSGGDLPSILKVIEDVDVSTLDDNHVRPNMGVPVWRGIWFPQASLR